MKFFCMMALALALVSCGSGSGESGNSESLSVIQGHINRIYLVVFENASYDEVVGASYMSFWNSLASQYAVATNYFANVHPSIGNYFMMTTGQIISQDDNFAGTIADDNIVRELSLAGKTSRIYAESLPSPGYLGPDAYPYLRQHDPFAYLTDVIASPATYLRPFSEFATDVAQGTAASFNFIAPNAIDDAHDCPDGSSSCDISVRLATADAWLQANIGPLLQQPGFQSGGLLIVAFDESETTDTANGGGHIAVLVVGSAVKRGFQSTAFHQHQSLYRLINELLGVNPLPGPAASAPDMLEFFR